MEPLEIQRWTFCGRTEGPVILPLKTLATLHALCDNQLVDLHETNGQHLMSIKRYI